MHPESQASPDIAFESAAASNGKTSNEALGNAEKYSASKPSMFSPLSYKAAESAKKGSTSTSRTGKGKQVSYEFGKPPKGIYVKTHPSPQYHTHNLPVPGSLPAEAHRVSDENALPRLLQRHQCGVKLVRQIVDCSSMTDP